MTIIGQHRSRRLAEHHRKELERKQGASIRMYRRNAKGRFSRTGHKFSYGPPKYGPPKAGAIVEWLVTLRVHSKNREGEISHKRQADFLVPAPAKATHEEIDNILWKLRRTIPMEFRWILRVPEEWTNATYIKTGAAPKFLDRIMIR